MIKEGDFMIRKFISKAFVILLLAGFIGWLWYSQLSKANTSTDKASKNIQILRVDKTNENLQAAGGYVEFLKAYNDYESLKNVSEVIIEGTVEDTNHFDFNTNTFIKSYVKVDKCLKGNIKVNDILTFVEGGGIKTSLCGEKISEKGDRVLIFANRHNDKYLPGTYYLPVDLVQGKFYICGNIVERKFKASQTTLNTLRADLKSVESSIK